ncbi:MAG: methyltransferase domain-containing protein [Mariniblastus sp.]
MSTSQQKTLQDFIQLQNRNAIAHAIRSAVELGVIEALREGQRTAEQLAEQLNVQPLQLKRLMDVIATTELIEQYEDDYALSPIARLIPDRFYDFGDEHWNHLTAHVRTGTPLPKLDGIALTDADYSLNKASEEWTLTPAALTAVKALDLGGSRKGLNILEVNCGAAVFGVAIAHSDPTSTITFVDDEFGLRRAKTTVESVELAERVKFIEAKDSEDFTVLPELADQKFDLVILAGQLHRRNHEQCKAMFNQLHTLVKPDYELVLIDVFGGQKEGVLQKAIFELELGLRTSEGQLHDPRILESDLKAAGFGQIQFAHLPTSPFYWGLILAQA